MNSTVKPASFKWKKHYDALIERSKNRSIKVYTENHHIVPSCMGGGDEPENMVRLTPEEHYVAHQMLMKIYPKHFGIIKGAISLLMVSPTTPRKNKMYGWIKRQCAEAQRALMIERHKTVPHPMLGKHHTTEAKTKISAYSSIPKKKAYCFDPETKELVKTYDGVKVAAKDLGIHEQTIFTCIRIPGKRSAGGFFWSYTPNPELPDNVAVIVLEDGTKSVRLKRGMKYNRKKL